MFTKLFAVCVLSCIAIGYAQPTVALSKIEGESWGEANGQIVIAGSGKNLTTVFVPQLAFLRLNNKVSHEIGAELNYSTTTIFLGATYSLLYRPTDLELYIGPTGGLCYLHATKNEKGTTAYRLSDNFFPGGMTLMYTEGYEHIKVVIKYRLMAGLSFNTVGTEVSQMSIGLSHTVSLGLVFRLTK